MNCLEKARKITVGGGDVAVYGAGSVASDLINALRKQNIFPSFIIDAKSTLSTLADLPIFNPRDSRFTKLKKEDVLIFMGIFNRSVDLSKLREEIAEIGWSNTVDFVDIHAEIPELLGDRYWLTDRKFYKLHQNKIQQAENLWADQTSRRLYIDTLKFRVTGDDTGIRFPDLCDQYFPKDIGLLQEFIKLNPLRFIDCGACIGDTFRYIRKQNYLVDRACFFEPDPDNFRQLVFELQKGPLPPNGAQLFPCGVSSKFEVLSFASAKGSASALAAAGDIQVTCLAIDEALPGFKPNFIKMDIEGAEQVALLGAQKTIEKSRPVLAISAYHRPDDLWALPLLINDWCLDYEFYLRQHMYRGFELVMYAVPKKEMAV